MAEYRGAARNQQQPANVVLFRDPDPERRNQQLCLDAGRALMLCGALVTIPTALDFGPANANRPASAANTTLAFAGFLFWILGACLCLLVLTPAAAPWAVTVASTVLKCLSPPVNY